MMSKIRKLSRGWNHKRVYRIYRELGLNLRVKPKKRIASVEPSILVQPIKANVCWSMDFMSDVLRTGRRFRTFNVLDDYNRECLLIEPSYTLPAIRVTELLDQIAAIRGYPDMVRVDNGPEFRSHYFQKWAKTHGVLVQFIQPGKPAQNGFIERFNRTYREDILDAYLFDGLLEVKLLTKRWMHGYNHDRPHQSLNDLTPVEFAMFRAGLNKRVDGMLNTNQVNLNDSTLMLS